MPGYIMIRKSAPVILLLVLALFFHSGRSWSATVSDPMERLRASVDRILQILQTEELRKPGKEKERRQRILEVVEHMFDFRDMARSSLGQTWHSISTAEQDKFVDLFRQLIEERYIGKIDAYENQKVVYGKELVKGDKALIYTDIIDKDLKIPIVYRLEAKNGRWLINDLKIENVSLIANYRRDFDSILRKERFDGLVEKITKQLEKSETSN